MRLTRLALAIVLICTCAASGAELLPADRPMPAVIDHYVDDSFVQQFLCGINLGAGGQLVIGSFVRSSEYERRGAHSREQVEHDLRKAKARAALGDDYLA